MKPPVNTKKLTTLSLLSAIALALYAVESALPPIVPIPGIKLVRPSVSCTVSPAVSCAFWQWYLCNGCCMDIICSLQV